MEIRIILVMVQYCPLFLGRIECIIKLKHYRRIKFETKEKIEPSHIFN